MSGRISIGYITPGCTRGPVDCATARISTGGCAQSAARSAEVTTTAQAPSVSRQKSNSRSGSEIGRAVRNCSSVSVRSCICAAGLRLAASRQASAISASASYRVP